MKNKLGYWLLGFLWVALQACADKPQPDKTAPTADLWSDIPVVSLPQTWSKVPTAGTLPDSMLLSQLQLQPDTVGPEPEWKLIGKLGTDQWNGLLYTYTDVDMSELHLTTYTKTDSLISDEVLISDRIVGILTSGVFSATITPKFSIQTSQRLRSAASETDSTIILDEQTDKKFQIAATGVIKNTANTIVNNVTQAATHPEEEEEGSYYREFRYEAAGQPESLVYTIMGKDREKQYYFENQKGKQRNLLFTGVAEANPDIHEFTLDGQKVSARWMDQIQEAGIAVPQQIVFTYTDNTRQVFVLKK